MRAKRTPAPTAARSPKPSVELVSGSVEEMQAFGERLGRALRAGDVVALRGMLGRGKTTLIQGIARGAGHGSQTLKSPTFVLMREYRGGMPLIHIDGYRLEGASAAAWLDLDQLFSRTKITLIEWAERFEGLFPEDHLEVELAHVSANRRRIAVKGTGPRSAATADTLRLALSNETPAESTGEEAGEG